MAKKILRTSQIQSLFVVTNGVAVFKLDFQMVNQQYYRAPLIIVNNWENIDPKLFGISVSALAYKLRFQRVTYILCYLPREYIELGQLLSFLPHTMRSSGMTSQDQRTGLKARYSAQRWSSMQWQTWYQRSNILWRKLIIYQRSKLLE